MKRIIAVDFDGVINSRGFYDSNVPREGANLNVPVTFALEGLLYLIKKDFKVVIFTTRTDFHEIKNWFRNVWEAHTELNKEELGQLLEIEITNLKPHAVAFIDDRAIRFTNWVDIIKYFT